MTAAEVKDALRRRHSATQFVGDRSIHGAWTTVEEYINIDLLAFSAHASPSSGGVPGVRYPRVGYEVKVSRSDYRRELLRPHKRVGKVGWCNAFFFAVPKGLLTDAEIAYADPGFEPDDFARPPCPSQTEGLSWSACWHGKREAPFIGPLAESRPYRSRVSYPCPDCGGKGHGGKSRVEREAPTLWIPPDVGLIEIDGRGCHVTRKAPVRKEVPGIDPGPMLAYLVRWVSVRPDPRHLALLRNQESIDEPPQADIR